MMLACWWVGMWHVAARLCIWCVMICLPDHMIVQPCRVLRLHASQRRLQLSSTRPGFTKQARSYPEANAGVPSLVGSLQQQLWMPQTSADLVAATVCKSPEFDPQLLDENVRLMARLFPRSSMRSIEKVLLKNPQLLLTQLSAWNDFLTAYGVSQHAFRGILSYEAAQIITNSSPFQAGTVILTLQQWGLSAVDINRSVLQKAPQVLLLTQGHLQQLYRFLGSTCGLPGNRIKDFVVASPHVLLQDIQQQLQPRVKFLQQELGADAQQLATCLSKHPGLLLADHATIIQPRLQQLRQFGFEGPELLQLVCADPAVLVFSIASLQRKWQYLTQQIGAGKQEMLLQCPTYFSKTLVTEVGPRHSYVVQHGLQRCLSCAQQQQQQQGLVPFHTTAPQGAQEQGSLHMHQQQQTTTQISQTQQQQQQLAQLQEQQQLHQQLISVEQQQQQAQADIRLHLGLLLKPSVPEFLALLGRADAADEFAAHAQHWAQTEGLKWTAARVTQS